MISEGFPVSAATLESDIYAAVVSVCANLDIDPSKHLTFRDGAERTERSIAGVLRDALHVSAVGVPPGTDIGIWRSA